MHASELRELAEMSWDELIDMTARVATELRRLGVGRGDRVVAYMPNIPETVAAFLATASIGAIWSSAAPEFGSPTVIDRFKQIEPKVLLAIDGYRYNGKDFDRTAQVEQLRAAIPSLEHTITVPYLGGGSWDLPDPEPLEFEQVPFDHPLWVLYSSGTTGLPKAIVQGQGGILIEHLKKANLHSDLSPDDRFFWFTTTGWMMWNFLVGGLLAGSAIVLYDGMPDPHGMWQFAADAGVTCFGTSAAFISACMKAEAEPPDLPRAEEHRLDRLTAAARGVQVDLRAREGRRVALLDERRHRPVHRVHRRLADPARVRGRAAGPGAGREGRGMGRGRARR